MRRPLCVRSRVGVSFLCAVVLSATLVGGVVSTLEPAAAATDAGVVGAPADPPKVAAGGSHSCVLLAGGTAKCWGLNTDGQLGNASNTDSNIALPVQGLANFVSAIAA